MIIIIYINNIVTLLRSVLDAYNVLLLLLICALVAPADESQHFQLLY